MDQIKNGAKDYRLKC